MTRYPKTHLVVRTTDSKPLPMLPGCWVGEARVRGVVVMRVPAAGLFIQMQGPSSCVTQSGPWAWAKWDRGAELLSFVATSFFSLDGSARVVHPSLLVLNQLWNEVTEASAGFQGSRSPEALPAEACDQRSHTLAQRRQVLFQRLTGVAQVPWIRNLGNTCCSQFDSNSNTSSEAQTSEVSSVRFPCRVRIFEVLIYREMVSV